VSILGPLGTAATPGLLYLPRMIVRMEKFVKLMVLAGETEVLGENLPDVTLSTTNPTYQTRARTWAAAVGSHRLTASAMARPTSVTLTYIAAEWAWTYSKHISRDRYAARLLERRSDLQKSQLPLLLRVGLCLQSCCLVTR
jgi:hypothetical protein